MRRRVTKRVIRLQVGASLIDRSDHQVSQARGVADLDLVACSWATRSTDLASPGDVALVPGSRDPALQHSPWLIVRGPQEALATSRVEVGVG
jgi:hypothetical protein